MTNKTRELLDFANEEPLAVSDFAIMLAGMNEDEIDHIEHVANNLLLGIGRIGEVPQEQILNGE